AGNFATLESAACGKERTLTDPVTGQPFPGNQIPTSRFSPQALKFLQYVPTSNDPCGKDLIAVPNNSNEDQFLTRVDWLQSEKHTVFGRYFFTDLRNPGAFDGKDLLLTTRAGVLDRVQSLTLGDTYSISGTAVNSFHFTWSRNHVTRGPASNLPTASDVGLNVAPSPGNFPLFSVSNKFSTFCGTCSLAHVFSASKQFAEDFTLIRGRHEFAMGGEWIHRNLNFQVSTQQNPEFDFNGQATNDPLADLLLGLPSTFIQGNLTRMQMVQNYAALYFQDKFRLSSRVSLNYGLRWEPYFPEHDTQGRATHFDMQAYLAGQHTAVFDNAPPGFTFAGDAGFPTGGTNRHLANFAPRLGLVWDINGNGRTVVRTAYGILYDLPPMQYFDRFGFGPPWASTITITSPAGGLANPYQNYPGGNPFPQPVPPPKNAVFPTGGQFINLPLNIRPPYMQQWDLSLQRQLGADWLFTVNYLGNKSTHRWLTRQLDPAVFLPGATLANEPSRRVLTLANKQAGAAVASLVNVDDGSNASYNGLLISANHRLARNFSVLANYTLSHCINEGDVQSEITGGYQDPNNRAGDRGNCYTDVRHIFNTSFVATSPRFDNRAEQTFLGDWELSTILTKRSGYWFSPAAGRDNSLTGIGADRPNAVGDSHVSDPSIQQWFNQAAFKANDPGTFGNAGRNSLQGPGSFNVDLAVMRYIPLGEARRLQIRVEAFNALNHAVFNNPRNSLTDANFGRILSANNPRILQFAMKLIF
ncbi:MAG: carboxypeptidase regulatory-like domain-containing protein, partial [Acidobacteriota bacterium]|nr:carboxypeptidase regulatory-like domain-containing protein [Acidobacteriota bacterium]